MKLEVRQWVWGEEQENAFEYLKKCLTKPPVLGYPDFEKPFCLHTDASLLGLGAVLYQEDSGVKKVIAYASRGLSKSEQRYPAHKLEFLALKWAVTDKFKDYLYGQRFTAVTDNNPLTYILSSAKLDATSQRWVAALAAYDFDIIYRPGAHNSDADGMSRHPSLKKPDEQFIPSDVIKALNFQVQAPCVESVSMSADVLQPLTDDPFTTDTKMVAEEQIKDPDLSFWIPWVSEGKKPRKDEIPFSRIHSVLRSNFDKMKLEDGVLYRYRSVDGEERKQLLLPRSQIPTVLSMVHDKMGHLGRDKTLSLLQDRFFWVGMMRDAEEWIKVCRRCVLGKSPTNSCAPLVNISSYQPLEIVCMDFLCLETSKGGYNDVLVITDHFTKYALAIPTKNTTAKTTADAFFHNFVVHYGLPKRIHSDRGPNFESQLLKDLCKVTGVAKSHTTPYHPMGNGLCERFNRTLISMLRTLENDQKKDWKTHISSLVHAYNCTRHETTGQSPYFLMFGRNPRLPVDLAFGLDFGHKEKSMTAYVGDLRQRLKKAYELASANVSKAQSKQKRNYDSKVRGTTIATGDRVLVKVVAFDGRHKLANKWEEEPYIVTGQPNADIPAYIVKKENGEGKVRTLHRNLLLPISYISGLDQPVPMPRGTKPPVTRSKRAAKDEDSDSSSSFSSTSSDEEVLLVAVDHPTDVAADATAGDTSGDQEESEPESEGDGDAQRRDSALDENAVSDQEDSDVSPPPVVTRQSQWTKVKPRWMRGDEFVFSHQTSTREPEWKERARFLGELAASGVFDGKEDSVKTTLLQIVSGTT
ncbi:hypothetical protein CI610_03263 [invertebrate metagenome]|uniref:Integrase catalytic domain-containing protein n=1 Tax=invertebrate metagenome TaxID=1711999 RepID=A0A2H9T3K6_9ZZZZ